MAEKNNNKKAKKAKVNQADRRTTRRETVGDGGDMAELRRGVQGRSDQRGRNTGEDEKATGCGRGAKRIGGDISAAVQKRDIQPGGAAGGVDSVGEQGGDG